MNTVNIGSSAVGEGQRVFVIAEAGINHNGSLDTAWRLIDAAADAGCNAVKFQKRNVRALLSREAYDRSYINGGNSHGRTYGEHREKLELSAVEHAALRDHALARGIHYMASPWDHESADFIDSLDVPAHKIGSPDLTNLPLCRRVAAFGKPVILSTGMSDPDEVDLAVARIREINPQIVLLHCVSIYPTPPKEIRLRRIVALRDRHREVVGYSGHEIGWHAVIAAVALGASVIEKHITLDRAMKGGDHHFSLEPAELTSMVAQIRLTEDALLGCDKPLLDAEMPFRRKLAKSVTTRISIRRGMTLTEDMLDCKSPATGVSPYRMGELVGGRATRDIEADSVIRGEDVSF